MISGCSYYHFYRELILTVLLTNCWGTDNQWMVNNALCCCNSLEKSWLSSLCSSSCSTKEFLSLQQKNCMFMNENGVTGFSLEFRYAFSRCPCKIVTVRNVNEFLLPYHIIKPENELLDNVESVNYFFYASSLLFEPSQSFLRALSLFLLLFSFAVLSFVLQ